MHTWISGGRSGASRGSFAALLSPPASTSAPMSTPAAASSVSFVHQHTCQGGAGALAAAVSVGPVVDQPVGTFAVARDEPAATR